MGIRGTTAAGKAAVEGNENSFTLLQDADGGVGQISVSNDGGNSGIKRRWEPPRAVSRFYSTTTTSHYSNASTDSSLIMELH